VQIPENVPVGGFQGLSTGNFVQFWHIAELGGITGVDISGAIAGWRITCVLLQFLQ
jgi:hypothetical protein